MVDLLMVLLIPFSLFISCVGASMSARSSILLSVKLKMPSAGAVFLSRYIPGPGTLTLSNMTRSSLNGTFA